MPTNYMRSEHINYTILRQDRHDTIKDKPWILK